MNVRPADFFAGDRSQICNVFVEADRSRDVHFDFRDWHLPCSQAQTGELIFTIAPCLLPWVFPVSGLPDAGTGASS
jgi:hypothetical protein